MRLAIVPAALLLSLSGCYLPPAGPDYTQPGYSPAGTYGYAQPGYPGPGYPPPPYDPNAGVYPGYSYNDGSPTLLVDGAMAPLVVVGGSWGYWDSHHNWHHAPEQVSRQLERQRAAGGSFHPGGYPPPRPPGSGEPYRGQTPYHLGEPVRPAGTQVAAPRPPGGAPPSHDTYGHEHGCAPGERC